jgi:hypothetical protein
MTLLQQEQNEAVDTNTDIAALLRRCRVLAQRLAVVEFKNWVIWELEGDPTFETLPDYRKISTPLILGHDRKAGEGMGDRVKGWIGSVALKVAEGTIPVASAAGTAAVTEAIRKYFGH